MSDEHRQYQARLAAEYAADGYLWAERLPTNTACPECAALRGQIVSIWDVAYNMVDHKYGKCCWRFHYDDPTYSYNYFNIQPVLDYPEGVTVEGLENAVIWEDSRLVWIPGYGWMSKEEYYTYV
jgi:hypothetical protein